MWTPGSARHHLILSTKVNSNDAGDTLNGPDAGNCLQSGEVLFDSEIKDSLSGKILGTAHSSILGCNFGPWDGLYEMAAKDVVYDLRAQVAGRPRVRRQGDWRLRYGSPYWDGLPPQ